MHRRTPWEIAEDWYREDDIQRAIRDTTRNDHMRVPENVHSPEFAAWLTRQYRLAMSKGIVLGRSGQEDQPQT